MLSTTAATKRPACSNPLCPMHGDMIVIFITRILDRAKQLGCNAECSHQEVHKDITGREVSFVSSVRYQTAEGWKTVHVEAPSQIEACFQLLLKIEALARAATGSPSA